MTGRLQATHRTCLNQLRTEVAQLRGVATRLEQMIEQVIEGGGQLHADGQVNFLTGSYARILKDIGAINNMQYSGAVARPKRG